MKAIKDASVLSITFFDEDFLILLQMAVPMVGEPSSIDTLPIQPRDISSNCTTDGGADGGTQRYLTYITTIVCSR
jgi:hypothetical protein